MSDNLITKYRPQSFDEVVGQSAVVRSLKQVCKNRDAQAFLFSGPKGTGKTTLAYLVAKAYGCTDQDILDVDAATKTGIDDMREIQELLRYRPFGHNGQRAVIIDECHGLSAKAWDSLLKILESPPKHVVWCLCSTEPAKIKETIKSRCASYQLRLLAVSFLDTLFDKVCAEENLKISDEVADVIIQQAQGSPRQLLSNIVVARAAKDAKEAAQLLKSALEEPIIIDLAKAVLANASWSLCMTKVKGLQEEHPETIRIVTMNYLAGCLKNVKSDKEAIILLQKLEAFSHSYVGTDGFAPLILSIGKALFAE